MEFEWDPKKNAANRKKHGVFFEEAAFIFADPNTVTVPDPDHSKDEERLVSIGRTPDGRLLTVCHTFRRLDPPLLNRLFSARKSTRKETLSYYGQGFKD